MGLTTTWLAPHAARQATNISVTMSRQVFKIFTLSVSKLSFPDHLGSTPCELSEIIQAHEGTAVVVAEFTHQRRVANG